MWTNKFLVLAYFALLISLVASHETSTQKPKRKQRYRIVKVYTRRFKNNATAQAQLLSTAQPLQVIPAERWAYRQKLKTSEEKPELPREMLQGEADSSRNTVNLGQMDLENFDVGKLLAAAGHVTGGDPLAPTVIRFSAPSGDSQLDPEYLSKILREQLGQDAQFQIMPASGNAGDNANFRQIYNAKPSQPSSGEQNPKQQGRQNPPPQQNLTPPTQQNLNPLPLQNLKPQPLQNSKHAPTARPAPPLHHFSKENTFPAVLQNGKAVEIKNHGTNYHGHQVTTPANHIPAFSTTANHNSAYSTTANHNPAYYSTTELPKTHYSKPTKKYPLYPRNPTGSQGANFSGFKIHTAVPTQPPKIQNADFFAGHSSFTSAVEAAAGYSTLSQEMTAPGLAPAVTGQYPDWNKGHEGQPPTTTDQQGKKYSTTFVRGFTDKDVGQPLPPGQQGQVPSGQPQKEASQLTKVKVLPEGRHYNHGPTQKPEVNLKVPAPKARGEPTGSASSAQAWEASGYYKGQQSEETGQQGSSESWGGQPHSEHAQSHDAGKLKFGPSKIEYGPPPPSGGYSDYQSESPPAEYGPPPPHHPKITKTIYINLPPEGASTTSTPKPYKHQHHQYVLPQKHYKIVFIKAPTAPPTEEPEIELPPPTPQTKTIIYVLHKKPEPPKKVVITAPPSTEPPSPEVFFIQYNDKEKQKSEEANNESGWNKPKNGGGWSKPETPKLEQKNQGWSKPVPKSEEPKNHGWKSTSSEQSKPEQKNTGWGKYEPTQSVQWDDVQDQGGWSKPETTVNSVWETQKSQVWGNPVPSTGTNTGWDSDPTTQEETDSEWTKDDKISGSGWSTGTDSKWEDHKTWSTGPDTGTKWNEPKNQGWSSNSKPGKVEKLEVSRESSSWGRPKINSEGWSPIFSGKEHQNYDDHTQGYAEDGYQAAASASAPMRVSVIKTVTTKICAHNKPC